MVRSTFSFVLLAVIAAVSVRGDGPQSDIPSAKSGELQTEILYTPDVCSQKTKSGDMLTMHYTGKLQDGTQFDSRYEKLTFYKVI